MAARKRTQDRPMMDMGGTPPAEEAKNFMEAKADEDRGDAKSKHANKGLRTAKDLLNEMAKAVAWGLATDDDDVKHMALEKTGDLGNAVRDACRAAMRAASTEKRNLQE